MSNFIVSSKHGDKVACRFVPGGAVVWREVKRDVSPPADLLEWSTKTGAAKFAAMHEGNVTTRLELFYSPRELTA